MKTVIKVENLRCSGCCNSINRTLGKIQGVFGVNVDMANKTITIDHTEEVVCADITKKLEQMGYPEEGSVKGMASLKASAKSVVSCAIGKVSSKA